MTKKKDTTQKMLKEEEKIRKIAKYILIAFCLQFIAYLVLINVVPIGNDINGDGYIEFNELNSLYYEKWDGEGQYKVNGERVYVDNGMQFIYGYNMLLLVATLCLAGYYILVFMDKNEGKAWQKTKLFFKENKALLILLIFMLWTFISCAFAKVPFRSFIGCFNLRDGYFSFMFYGSVLICMMLLGKDNNKDKKTIMNLFLITTTIIALVTLGNYYANVAGKDFPIAIKHIGTDMTCGIFNNSNHYGYLLSISVVVAAAMLMKEEKILLKLAYFASFAIMAYMLVLNNTFGAYIGVGIALLLMFIHNIVMIIQNLANSTGKTFIPTIAIVAMIGTFIVMSCTIKNVDNELIAKKNFEGIISDIQSIVFSNTQTNQEEINEESQTASGEQPTSTSSNDAAEAGSGRWKLWVGGLKLIKNKPIIGYGLENMKAEYIEQLHIGEGRSHNLLIQLAGTTGIPGMLLYMTGILMILFRNLKYYKEWDIFSYTGVFVIISYIISSIVGNSGFYTSGYFYIFVGLVALTPKKKKQDALNK